jgi:ribosomal protein S18 acetylase RimI-like enzyme
MQKIFLSHNSVPGITFRLAVAHDLQALRENCYPDTDWGQFQEHYGYLLKWQEIGRCYILIAEYGTPAQIIGSGQLIRQGEKAEIAELVVHKAYRNLGIGTAMIQILSQIAWEKDTQFLEIGAAVENLPAIRLYRRLGFGRDRFLDLPDGQKAVLLTKYLTP